jgi:hypothetical protein
MDILKPACLIFLFCFTLSYTCFMDLTHLSYINTLSSPFKALLYLTIAMYLSIAWSLLSLKWDHLFSISIFSSLFIYSNTLFVYCACTKFYWFTRIFWKYYTSYLQLKLARTFLFCRTWLVLHRAKPLSRSLWSILNSWIVYLLSENLCLPLALPCFPTYLLVDFYF